MKINIIKQALPDDPAPRSCPWVIEFMNTATQSKKK
jgi:hypothetical protein